MTESNNLGCAIIIVLIVSVWGEPDMWDAAIHYLMEANNCGEK